MNTNKSSTGIDPQVNLSYRRVAVITGVVFIIATVAPLLTSALVPVLTDANYLTSLSANANQVAAGALLYIIGYFACAGIAVVMLWCARC